MLDLKQIQEELEINRRSIEMISRIHAQNERRAVIVADILRRLQARHGALTEKVRTAADRDAVPREFATTARHKGA